jgi:UDP-N-acetylglucosamine transferase subunit ALG13
MIFVTVGTHEQQFNRLVKALDDLVVEGAITEPVFQQTGYSTYVPEHCEHSRFVSASLMKELMAEADVIITHGGPSSFIEAMAAGKTPVVVPRRADFGEHVNDHQADFVRIVAERQGGIVPVYDVSKLPQAIERAREMSEGETFHSHNAEFCKELSKLIGEL